MPEVADRVRETTTTVGTGTVVLAGAVTGFRAFSAAFASGTDVYYCIAAGAEWEVGYGAVTTGTPWTLARTSVLASSNAGALVNFSAGTKDVFCTIPAATVRVAATGAEVDTGADNTKVVTPASLAASEYMTPYLLVLDVTAGGDFTLTAAQNKATYIKATGTPTVPVRIIVKDVMPIFTASNATSGVSTVEFKTAATAGVPVGAGTHQALTADGSVEYPTSAGAGSGDMILSQAQTNSGAKTFLNATLLLRNVANTFSSWFTNTNTAARTYTLQDRNGILADDTDLAAKMAIATYDTDADGVVDAAEAMLMIVRNNTGSTIPKMSVVHITGATGQNSTVGLAKADAEATSSKTIGVTTADIANNATGYIATGNGMLHNYNTSAFIDGATLWLSATVAGGITATRPVAPNHAVLLGFVAYSHNNSGKIVLTIINGQELNELHNVLITSVADNELLQYDAAAGVWKNRATLIPTAIALSTMRI
ncbi:MAG: hypothetical protein WC736_15810 [Gallionella sp.]|jgi:hypothetical protein